MYRGGPDPAGRETEEQAGATQLKRCILNIRLQVFGISMPNIDFRFPQSQLNIFSHKLNKLKYEPTSACESCEAFMFYFHLKCVSMSPALSTSVLYLCSQLNILLRLS